MVPAVSLPRSHTPEVTITRPVKVTTMMVSMNVWVIDTRPWRVGWVVLAAAAAMAAEPIPDSLEKMPRATPIWMAYMIAAPAKPPTADVPEKACVKICPKAPGIASALSTRTTIPPSRYSTIIRGTNPAVTRPMALMPPSRTAPVRTNRMTPEATTGTPKELSSWAATALPCVMLPMPKLARTANTANTIDRTSPTRPPVFPNSSANPRWR